MKRRRRLRGSPAWTICATAFLCGCLALRTPDPDRAVDPAAGEGCVFGRVRVFQPGFELTPWKREIAEILSEDPVLRLSLFHVDSERKRPDVPISEEGEFEWILPAGTYLLYHTPSVEPPFNEPLAAFQVAGGPNPVDLGELRLMISVDRPLSSRLATYTLSNADAASDGGEMAESFLRRHPGTAPVRPGAFVVDEDLGDLFANWSRAACARILARHGLDLDRSGGR